MLHVFSKDKQLYNYVTCKIFAAAKNNKESILLQYIYHSCTSYGQLLLLNTQVWESSCFNRHHTVCDNPLIVILWIYLSKYVL